MPIGRVSRNIFIAIDVKNGVGNVVIMSESVANIQLPCGKKI